MDLEKLKYPIGKYESPEIISEEHIKNWTSNIEYFPQKLEELTKSLSLEQLSYHYRPDGWTIRQVVHHLADSHLNSFARFKLTLTEENPTIRPYEESLWARTADADNDEIELSLNLLAALHARWTIFLKNLKLDDYDRTYFHPADKKQYTLKWMLGLYDWHCNHHFAHIKQALKLKGVFKD